MSDSDDNSDADFLGFTREDVNEWTDDINFNDRYSDISISPVSTPATSDSEEENSNGEDSQTSCGPGTGITRWTDSLTRVDSPLFTQQTGATFQFTADKRELDFFLKFFVPELFKNLAIETNYYAAVQIGVKPDNTWRPTDETEMRAFVGIHMLMAVVEMPCYKMYWSSDWLTNLPSIKQIMTRGRFESLSKYLHCNDTSKTPPRGQPGHDKLSHIRPFIDTVLQQCKTQYNVHRECSVDEAMVGFRGRLAFRQYMPAKPTKFGIKVWALGDSHNGYVGNFQVYTGKVEGAAEKGLTNRVVKDMTDDLKGKSHLVVFDNYFSSCVLLQDLEKDQIYCCATTRTNRKDWPPALSKKCIKKQGEFKIRQGKFSCSYLV